MIDVINADVLAWAAAYDGAPFHALICDPPYHLNSIVKRFANSGGADRQPGAGPYARTSRGFMGKKWDGGDIAFQPDTWAALADHLHPGAFLIAFSGSRGWHRQAVAMEDAGLLMHPTIFGWLYGSGFPKATRIDTQVDRAAGAERARIPNPAAAQQTASRSNSMNDKAQLAELTLPATPLAQAWAGHRYGLQALKPALEPIFVFQKPYAGRPVDDITRTGAGALNIDLGRIGTSADAPQVMGSKQTSGVYGAINVEGGKLYVDGRWPSNFVLDAETAERLDQQTGNLSVTGNRSEDSRAAQVTGTTWGPDNHQSMEYPGDDGAASRFYFRADWNLEQAEQLMYCGKASRKERDAGLGSFPLSARPTMGSGIGGQPDQQRENNRNPHPTVKPISLCRWLASLLLPPATYAPRRILVPFAGVGSEMIGAFAAGWNEVVGIERESEYVPIARARLAYWTERGFQLPFELETP